MGSDGAGERRKSKVQSPKFKVQSLYIVRIIRRPKNRLGGKILEKKFRLAPGLA